MRKKVLGLRLGMQIQPLAAAGFEEIEGSFPAMVRERMGRLVVQPIFVSEHGRRIADLAARNCRPTISDPGRTKSLGKTEGVKRDCKQEKAHE